MADNLGKRPSKGILKNSSSFDKPDGSRSRRESKGTKWDEMNIIATLHPPDKDYGHMKIDEPKTPYNYAEDEDGEHDGLDANVLAEKIKSGGAAPPKFLQSDDQDDDDDGEELTPEERARRKEFIAKRKKHYNEYYAVKLARKNLAEELSDDDEDDDENEPKNIDENSMDVDESSPSSSKSPSPTNTAHQSSKKYFCPLRARSKSPQK